MSDLLVDEDHATALVAVALSYRNGEANYAMMAMITAIIILSESIEMDIEKTAKFVAEMICSCSRIKKDPPECQPN